MSEKIEGEAVFVKEDIRENLSGALLKLMLKGGHDKSPEEFAQEAKDLGSCALNFMKAADLVAADMKIAAEEGIVLNEKGEAVMMVPVKKEKPIKKVTVTHKNIGDLWDKIQGEIDNFVRCYPDGLQTDKVLKENIGTMLGKFVDDNRL
tara:strand:- start:2541 stop:2987 length:447 start_codon:yes stop_codon:yes gene_type:complete